MSELKECDSCPRKQETLHIDGTMRLCDVCYQRTLDYRKVGVEINSKQNAVPTTYNNSFNNEILSFVDLKKAIDAMEGLSMEEKSIKYQNEVVDRLVQLRQVLIEQRKIIQENENREAAVMQELRKLGTELREEFRQKIKESDLTYQPVIKNKKSVVKPAIKKSLSGFDKIVAQLATARDITMEQARDIILKNPALMAVLPNKDNPIKKEN